MFSITSMREFCGKYLSKWLFGALVFVFVVGSVAYFGNAGAGSIVVAAQLEWNVGSTPSYMAIYTTPSGSIGAVERMRIDSSGNVGVGTTAPQAVLHVTGSLRLDVVSTTGANTATLTNAPVSGNPAGWARVNINGVARVIPYW